MSVIVVGRQRTVDSSEYSISFVGTQLRYGLEVVAGDIDDEVGAAAPVADDCQLAAGVECQRDTVGDRLPGGEPVDGGTAFDEIAARIDAR